MIRLIVWASLMALACCAWCDEPFRNHRYDSWKVLEMPEDAIVFVGNSITDMHPWAEAFGNDKRIVNRGNSGALSSEVVEHMDCWLEGKPSKVFLMIGTNDLGSGLPVEHVVENIRKVAERVRAESPETMLYLESILPAKDQKARTMETIAQANEGIRQIADEYENTEYVDLFALLMGVVEDKGTSFDQLHLTAAGYRVWCEAIAPLVGLEHCYGNDVVERMAWGNLYGSDAMRATYFSVLGYDEGDILFFGDEMVKNGEWNELLQNPRIKNRGTGWGYGGSLEKMAQMAEVTLGESAPQASKICLYAGAQDVASERKLKVVEHDYRAIVERLLRYSKSEVVLVGLMPRTGDNARERQFNKWLKRYSEKNARLKYIDLYQLLTEKDGTIKQGYVKDNYLYGQGYIVLAEALRSCLEK
ncbi:MAG: GDSL-type esterase/lipase family protein [Bacteroidales bacterium]|nr:GDSL-type esterase/lipase family protein [Bacteroidales bacterium]